MSDDLYRSITDRIVAALEGSTPPWVRPWSQVSDAVPINAQTKRTYRSINFALLSLEANASNYAANRWLTYRQASELGAQVRRGERGAPVIYWQLRKVAATGETHPDEIDPPEIPDKVYPLLRAYSLFNVAQIDGLPTQYLEASKPTWEPEAKAEELLLMSDARFRQGGTRAYYQPATDEIYLPPVSAFLTACGYYATALHELTHWTSHASRCNRQLGKRFGDAAYAAEELIAEMGAAYLCAHCRIDGELRHASYLQSWLRVLRSDKRAIFTASAQAQRAADYVLTLAQPPRTRLDALAA